VLEREVLDLIGQGLRTGEMARRLFVSEDTVKTHINILFAKADLHSLADAVRLALALCSYGRIGLDGSRHRGQHGQGEAERQGGEADERAVQHQNDAVGAAGSLHGVLLGALWLCRPGWMLATSAGPIPNRPEPLQETRR
jgi:DNA-binding CsgD family transcriptional regulator